MEARIMSIKNKKNFYTAAFAISISLSSLALAATQVITYSDGSQYKGEVIDGKRHGEGFIQWVNGDTYEGQWLNDMPHGQGKKTYIDGSVYEGEFFQGLQQGKGVFIYPDGTTYSGDWKSDAPNGLGTFEFQQAGTYNGAVMMGLPHGQGSFTYSNGDFYDGQWQHGKREGMGTLYYKDGSVYIGNFIDGKPNGTGSLTYSNGKQFKGNFTNGKPNGDGTCYSPQEQALCSYENGVQVAYAVIPDYVNEPPEQAKPATPIQPAQPPKPKKQFVQALAQEKKRLKPIYSANDLHKDRSDILFTHNFESLNLNNTLRTGWWKKQSSLFSEHLKLHARSGELEIELKVKRFKGPGIYRIKPADVKAWFGGKPLQGLRDFAHTVTIKAIEDSWIEGNLNLSFNQKDSYGDYYKVENGVFRLNQEPVFSPEPLTP